MSKCEQLPTDCSSSSFGLTGEVPDEVPEFAIEDSQTRLAQLERLARIRRRNHPIRAFSKQGQEQQRVRSVFGKNTSN